MDISGILSGVGVQLEAQAFRAFGAAVRGQDPSLAGALNSSPFGQQTGVGVPNTVSAPTGKNPHVWQITPYAAATASGIGGFDPKNRFLFKVSFTFAPDVAAIAASMGVDLTQQLNRDMTYVVKHIEMPKFTLEYQEANFYNFRSKILTRVKHDELAFSMYDDVANNAMNFINAYIKMISPVTRTEWTTNSPLEQNGFAFATNYTGIDTSNRGVIGGNGGTITGSAKSILSQMVIEQYYLDRSQKQLTGQQIRQAIKLNRFVFTNPRLINFRIEDQDHEVGNQASMISCGFDFDALHIDTGKTAVDVGTPTTGYMETNDILSDRVPGTSGSSGVTNAGGGGGLGVSAFSSFVAQQGTPSTLNYNSLLQAGVNTGTAGGGLNTPITGLLGTNASRTLASTSNGGIASGIASTPPPIITDDTSGNTDVTQVVDDGSEFFGG